MSWSFSVQFFIPEHTAVVLTHVWFERQDAGDIVEAVCSQCIGGICRSTEIEVLILPENLCQRKAFWLAHKNNLVFTWFSHYLSVYSLVRCCIRSRVKLHYATIVVFPLHFPPLPFNAIFFLWLYLRYTYVKWWRMFCRTIQSFSCLQWQNLLPYFIQGSSWHWIYDLSVQRKQVKSHGTLFSLFEYATSRKRLFLMFVLP